MSNDTTTSMAVSRHLVFGDAKKNWGWILALGIISLILGIIGLGMTVMLTLAGVLLFGILLLIGSGFQFFDAFKCKGWKMVLWHIIIAVLYLIAGIAMIINPLRASLILTLVFAGVLIVVGIARLIMAFQLKGLGNWGWTLFGGIVSIILGGIIFAQWPISGLWVIGLFVAIELIVNGWSYIFVALAAKNAGSGLSPGVGTANV
ncbi:MAG: DUF308 domain-containing protein [Deltaproteobacteria bacterium]